MGLNTIDFVFFIVAVAVDVVVSLLIANSRTRTLMEKFHKEQQERSDNIIQVATGKARSMDLEAKDRSLKLMQEVESETIRRRTDLSHEEERLTKRRGEMGNRLEKLELREQNLNKRQSALDKRTNDIEKLVSQQMDEIQRVAAMSTEEARVVLLAEVEKESRNDMVRIIRQVESEARSEGENRAR